MRIKTNHLPKNEKKECQEKIQKHFEFILSQLAVFRRDNQQCKQHSHTSCFDEIHELREQYFLQFRAHCRRNWLLQVGLSLSLSEIVVVGLGRR